MFDDISKHFKIVELYKDTVSAAEKGNVDKARINSRKIRYLERTKEKFAYFPKAEELVGIAHGNAAENVKMAVLDHMNPEGAITPVAANLMKKAFSHIQKSDKEPQYIEGRMRDLREMMDGSKIKNPITNSNKCADSWAYF